MKNKQFFFTSPHFVPHSIPLSPPIPPQSSFIPTQPDDPRLQSSNSPYFFASPFKSSPLGAHARQAAEAHNQSSTLMIDELYAPFIIANIRNLYEITSFSVFFLSQQSILNPPQMPLFPTSYRHRILPNPDSVSLNHSTFAPSFNPHWQVHLPSPSEGHAISSITN